MNRCRSDIWPYWRINRWLLLSMLCAVLLIVIGHFGPGDPLSSAILWTGIVALVLVIGQGVHSAISRWCFRASIERYFDAVWNGKWPCPCKEVTMADYRKWCRAQDWRFWWKLVQAKKRR